MLGVRFFGAVLSIYSRVHALVCDAELIQCILR
jgi:hypothetical protein